MAEPKPARPDRPAAGLMAHVRIAEELERLRRDPAWQEGHRNAITMSKAPGGLRVVLTMLRKGTALQEHQASGPLTLQVLSGSLRFGSGGKSATMWAGDLVVLGPALGHEVEALEDAAFLLTLGPPS